MVPSKLEAVMKSIGRYVASLVAVVGLGTAFAVGILPAQPDQQDTFNQHDIRVFKTTACTKDHKPVEALYYIAASRSDMARGKSSPSSKLMKEEIDNNWRHIASRLTNDQVMDERFADVYHSVLSETIPLLQRAVEETTGVSISVSEVNSRTMDPAKDKDVPACGQN
ncbi:MAG TPA: hypothetical protein VFB56_11150 [Nitrospiraceae bacterium]|nr:hypothetical protein [Nitrospiraceae bacterium]